MSSTNRKDGIDLAARSRARRRALQATYAWQISRTSMASVIRQFEHEQEMEVADIEYFHDLLNGIENHRAELDAKLRPFLDREVEEVDPIERAVLRIAAPREKLQPVPMGSSRELQVGQTVYAIGNPFGLDQTLTRGIVSALNREIESMTQRTIRGAIQTDAAINPGNSGGPLLDSAGRLIGVNTSIFSPSGGSNGIGFAIPADEVNRVVPQLIQHGRVIRPALGLTAGTEQLRQVLRLPKGVVLIGLQAGGGAQRAGLQPFMRGRDGRIVGGDVITAVNGKPVADLDELLSELEERRVGDKVTLMLDSGVRRGTDVLKAIALGARFVFVGRPFLYAAAVAGVEGVSHAIGLLRDEVDRDMAMLGVRRCAELTPEFLVRR